MESSPTYSLENSLRFNWGSMTGALNTERVRCLEQNLSGQNILDAGCGGGAYVEFLCSQGFRVTGVDYHGMFLDVARHRPGAQGTYVQGDIIALPFPDQSFDCAYCFDVLEHVDDQQALRELLRVTRKKLILTIPASDANHFGTSLTFHHYQDLTHLRTYTRASLAALFHAASQSRFDLVPELPATIQDLVASHLDASDSIHPVKRFARRMYHAILRPLIKFARFRKVPTGFIAIIDIMPSA